MRSRALCRKVEFNGSANNIDKRQLSSPPTPGQLLGQERAGTKQAKWSRAAETDLHRQLSPTARFFVCCLRSEGEPRGSRQVSSFKTEMRDGEAGLLYCQIATQVGSGGLDKDCRDSLCPDRTRCPEWPCLISSSCIMMQPRTRPRYGCVTRWANPTQPRSLSRATCSWDLSLPLAGSASNSPQPEARPIDQRTFRDGVLFSHAERRRDPELFSKKPS